MMIVKQVTALRHFLSGQKENGIKTGFVPTMGALHQGHISLIERSKNETGLTICSIFVNPAQFNDPTDFRKYPVNTENDILLLEKAGCDVLFLPTVDEIYPGGQIPDTHYPLGYLETILEGKYRPGHFQGVCKVVHRLLDAVQPDNLYLGQKDYQQCMVIEKLVQLIGPGLTPAIIQCPTLREPDGLAMSSRNMRLTQEERQTATTIYQSLLQIKEELQPGNLSPVIENAKNLLKKNGFKTDYVSIADAQTLQPVDQWDGQVKLVALIAAFLNEVRLIDNLLLN
ncbi:MAG TPA: pantoate--beta-alanine ligase [Chitinophagaceae bacterium]|jgi:pantoate--beta-alanine ligase|nr:pantoate--beta-alanine ligase [Chitinophagaceae bacterium]